jgi:SAM-dependent methyltransferase
MDRDDVRLWADRSALTEVQYRTDANLATRQSIYAYQQPPLDLPRAVIDLAGLTGRESVVDVGCGNGLYLAELARRQHAGPVAGVDLSPGMLAAAGGRAPQARLITGDAAALPLQNAMSDVTIAMHMLYHVPEPRDALGELRRVTRPGGQVLIGLNADDHLLELRQLLTAVLRDLQPAAGLPSVAERLSLEQGASLVRPLFGSVTRHDFAGQLLLPGPEAAVRYLRSMLLTQTLADPGEFIAAVSRRAPAGPDGVFRITTHSGCLVCS